MSVFNRERKRDKQTDEQSETERKKPAKSRKCPVSL